MNYRGAAVAAMAAAVGGHMATENQLHPRGALGEVIPKKKVH
jgi:hypothetical protein